MALHDQFKALTVWDKATLQTCIDEVCATFDMNMGKIAQPLRVAITGGSMSPAIDVTLCMIGQARVLKRLATALGYVRERAAGIAS